MKKNKSNFNIGIIIIAVVFLVTAIVGPHIINCLYKKNTGYITLWEAKDTLAYFGVILGGLATIVSLVITILYNNKQIRIEQKQQLNIIIADYKKATIEERYNKIFFNCQKIKSKILLEFFEKNKDDFWKLLFSQNRWIDNIMDIFNITNYMEDLESIEYSDEDVEKRFLENISNIRSGIGEIIQSMVKELEQLQQQEESKNNLPKISADLYSISNKYIENKPTVQSVYTKYRKEIIKYRDEYKPDFLKVYSELIKYKEQCKDEEIKKLYDFQED